MTRRNWRTVGMAAIVFSAILWFGDGPASRAYSPRRKCTAAASRFDPLCAVEGSSAALVRHICDYFWVAEVCSLFQPDKPQYVSHADPSPGKPFALRVGAVHNHSGYSDGDPFSIPADYYRAGRTGHNEADAGGDTGVIIDFMIGSEHSDNEKIPITTAAACLEPDPGPLACAHFFDNDHYWKWTATQRQAIEGTEFSESAGYTGFTGMRGFEYTNDYFNHINVFFSQNVINVKTDGSYASMDLFWNWLRRAPAKGGGRDALITFNHPGGDPHLSPFDSGLPHTQLLGQVPGGSNWNDLAYVPDVDRQVAGIEVNGGDDIEWFVKALDRGWHLGPVAAEDEHQREWSTSRDGKTLMLTRGRGPRDYYFALENHRTVAIREELVDGTPGSHAIVPTIHYYANGSGIQDPAASVLGSTIASGTTHTLNLELSGLPAGSRVALVTNTTGGQAAPIAMGAADGSGAFTASHPVTRPAVGQDWYFAVVCPPSTGAACGSNQEYSAVTAPIWFAA